MSTAEVIAELPLFPLGSVLFPGGLLQLKIFEARYLDLMTSCMREGKPFGVVPLLSGEETQAAEVAVALHPMGTLAELLEVDSPQAGILHVQARGTRRFSVAAPHQLANGLWVGQATLHEDDAAMAPTPAHERIVEGLAEAIKTLAENGIKPFLEPLQLDSAGWVANRWCEILPFPIEAKLRLLAMADPLSRLDVIGSFLDSGKPAH